MGSVVERPWLITVVLSPGKAGLEKHRTLTSQMSIFYFLLLKSFPYSLKHIFEKCANIIFYLLSDMFPALLLLISFSGSLVTWARLESEGKEKNRYFSHSFCLRSITWNDHISITPNPAVTALIALVLAPSKEPIVFSGPTGISSFLLLLTSNLFHCSLLGLS